VARRRQHLTYGTAGPRTGLGDVIVDRDLLDTAHFRALLRGAGVHLLRLPANRPNLNAYAERIVQSITYECMRRILPLGERHLSAVVHEFVEHDHAESNHQGLGTVIPSLPAIRLRPSDASADAKGSVACFRSMRKRRVNPGRSKRGTRRREKRALERARSRPSRSGER
jgi:hypothetical protein